MYKRQVHAAAVAAEPSRAKPAGGRVSKAQEQGSRASGEETSEKYMQTRDRHYREDRPGRPIGGGEIYEYIQIILSRARIRSDNELTEGAPPRLSSTSLCGTPSYMVGCLRFAKLCLPKYVRLENILKLY